MSVTMERRVTKPQRIMRDLVADEGDWIYVDALCSEYQLRRGVSYRSAMRAIDIMIEAGVVEVRHVPSPIRPDDERREVRWIGEQ